MFKFLNLLAISTLKIHNKLNELLQKYSSNFLKIESKIVDSNARSITYTLINSKLNSHVKVLEEIFYTIVKDETFRKFGSKKVIIVTGVSGKQEFSFHHNILITNSTSFNDYYNQVKDNITTLYDNGYPIDIITQFKVKVWNMDAIQNSKIKQGKKATIVRGFHTSALTAHKFITPLKKNSFII